MKSPIEQHNFLVNSMLENMEEAKNLQIEIDKQFGLEDLVYRFYHQSFKVYRSQYLIKDCLELFQKIAGDELKLDKKFLKIVEDGTGHVFDLSHNEIWLEKTRPQIEALFHCKYVLDNLIKYTEFYKDKEEQKQMFLPSGWAAIMTIFGSR